MKVIFYRFSLYSDEDKVYQYKACHRYIQCMEATRLRYNLNKYLESTYENEQAAKEAIDKFLNDHYGCVHLIVEDKLKAFHNTPDFMTKILADGGILELLEKDLKLINGII